MKIGQQRILSYFLLLVEISFNILYNIFGDNMAKLYFRYGAMGSGKSIDLLKVAYNYEERGKKVLVFTAKIDDRVGMRKSLDQNRFVKRG